MHDYLDFFVAEMKHPTFVQSILAEWYVETPQPPTGTGARIGPKPSAPTHPHIHNRWATTLFLFFLILSVLPGANGGQEIFRIGVVAVRAPSRLALAKPVGRSVGRSVQSS